MEVMKNRIRVGQKQVFSLHKRIEYQNGAPHIISSEFNDLHLVLSVSTSAFIKEGKFIQRWWAPVKDNWLRFYVTTPIVVPATWKPDVPTEGVPEKANPFWWPDTINGEQLTDGSWTKYVLKNYTQAVYNAEGTTEYYYFKFENSIVTKVPYEFSYDKTFYYDDIKDLQGLNYLYDIREVDGINNLQYMYQIADEYMLKGRMYTFTFNGNLWNVQWWEDENNISKYEQGWYFWTGFGTIIDAEQNDLLNELTTEMFLQFLQSSSVLEIMNKEDRKEYLNLVKKVDLEVPIIEIDYENVLMRPTQFDILSSVEGGK